MLTEEQTIQKMYDADRVDGILNQFRQKKRASRKDTSSLEDRLIGEWNSNYKISREDYGSILKQNAKYLVDYVTDDIAGKVSEHLLTEIELLSRQ